MGAATKSSPTRSMKKLQVSLTVLRKYSSPFLPAHFENWILIKNRPHRYLDSYRQLEEERKHAEDGRLRALALLELHRSQSALSPSERHMPPSVALPKCVDGGDSNGIEHGRPVIRDREKGIDNALRGISPSPGGMGNMSGGNRTSTGSGGERQAHSLPTGASGGFRSQGVSPVLAAVAAAAAAAPQAAGANAETTTVSVEKLQELEAALAVDEAIVSAGFHCAVYDNRCSPHLPASACAQYVNLTVTNSNRSLFIRGFC